MSPAVVSVAVSVAVIVIVSAVVGTVASMACAVCTAPASSCHAAPCAACGAKLPSSGGGTGTSSRTPREARAQCAPSRRQSAWQGLGGGGRGVWQGCNEMSHQKKKRNIPYYTYRTCYSPRAEEEAVQLGYSNMLVDTEAVLTPLQGRAPT